MAEADFYRRAGIIHMDADGDEIEGRLTVSHISMYGSPTSAVVKEKSSGAPLAGFTAEGWVPVNRIVKGVVLELTGTADVIVALKMGH